MSLNPESDSLQRVYEIMDEQDRKIAPLYGDDSAVRRVPENKDPMGWLQRLHDASRRRYPPFG